MVSLKDLARQNGVSYEAIRQQVKRYADELTGHIVVEGRTQFLDDFAVDFLDAKRKSNPVVVFETSKDEEIERLEAENKTLLLRLSEKQEKIEQLQDRLIEAADASRLLTEANIRLEVEKGRSDDLQRQNEVLEAELTQLRQQQPKGWFARLFQR